MTHTIDEIVIPAFIDDADAADFVATVEVRNAVEAFTIGFDDVGYPPAELLPHWLDSTYEPKRLFAVRVDGSIVARAVYETRPQMSDSVAWLDVQVLPRLSSPRHRNSPARAPRSNRGG